MWQSIKQFLKNAYDKGFTTLVVIDCWIVLMVVFTGSIRIATEKSSDGSSPFFALAVFIAAAILAHTIKVLGKAFERGMDRFGERSTAWLEKYLDEHRG